MSEQKVCQSCGQVIDKESILRREFLKTEVSRNLVRRELIVMGIMWLFFVLLSGLVFWGYLNPDSSPTVLVAMAVTLVIYLTQTTVKRNRLFREFKVQRQS